MPTMDAWADLKQLLSQTLRSRDVPRLLYAVCDTARRLTRARNAMVAIYNEELGYMTLRAGSGKDWQPEMVGERISVGESEHEGITAWVAAKGASYLSPDVSQESAYRVLIPTTRSELASPVFDRNSRIRGVLNVESDEVGRFSQADVAVLETLAEVLGLALDRQDAREREQAMREVSTALDLAQSEEDLLQRVAVVIERTMHVSAYSIFLWNEVRQEYVLRDVVGTSALPKDASYKKGEGCTGWVCEHGEPILLHYPFEDERWAGKHLEFPLEETSSFLVVPIVSAGKSYGCIRAIRKKAKNPYINNAFTQEDMELLCMIGEQVGVGIEKIRSMQRQLHNERMAAWGELSAKSSHMLGNRLFALKGDISELRYLLSDETVSREEILRFVDRLEQGVSRMDAMLQEFRDFVAATRLKYQLSDLNEVVKNAATSAMPGLQSERLQLELDPSLEPFYFDAAKLERVVSELVENALHWAPEGKITLRTGRATDQEIFRARLAPENGPYARVEVLDEGPGVAQEKKERIFDPYYSDRTKGLGLGLSIVEGVVQAHRGNIYEDGEPGKGARFVILLPIYTNPPAED
ncbi:MAG: GAF domain-containing protein [Armatimonadetes bacterium]|nr:MAG: GAF domain-containing protein [Armatimonadota bacterium]